MRILTHLNQVLSGAYHGHTEALIDISPYKWTPGSPHPAHVKVIDMPDTFRGRFRNEDGKATEHYVQQV